MGRREYPTRFPLPKCANKADGRHLKIMFVWNRNLGRHFNSSVLKINHAKLVALLHKNK